jgi:hypothetical protein
MIRTNDPKTWGDLRKHIAKLGAKLERVKGTHEAWVFNDGYTFIALRARNKQTVPVMYLVNYRKIMTKYKLSHHKTTSHLIGRANPNAIYQATSLSI